VVAAGKDFDAGVQEVVGDLGSDPEARCGIFAVGDAQIDLALDEDVRQPVVDDFAARGAYDVADE
jgi:hypothetical protein